MTFYKIKKIKKEFIPYNMLLCTLCKHGNVMGKTSERNFYILTFVLIEDWVDLGLVSG